MGNVKKTETQEIAKKIARVIRRSKLALTHASTFLRDSTLTVDVNNSISALGEAKIWNEVKIANVTTDMITDVKENIRIAEEAIAALDKESGRDTSKDTANNAGNPQDDSDDEEGSSDSSAADLDEKKKRELVASAKSAEASYEKAINLAKKKDNAAPNAVEVAIKHNRQFLGELDIFPINGYTPSNVKSLKAEATKRVNELEQTKTKLDETAKVGAKAKAGVDADDDDSYIIY